jgi:hypothetical protein
MKQLKIFLVCIGIVFLLFLFLIFAAYKILSNQKLPYRNILDSYGYIYTDVKYKNDSYTVIIEGYSFYCCLKHYMNKNNLFKFQYPFIIYNSIRYNNPISINDTLNKELSYLKVNKALSQKFENLNFLKGGYIKPNGFFEDSIDHNTQKAIMYILLRKGIMDCHTDCESGYSYVIPEIVQNKSN